MKLVNGSGVLPVVYTAHHASHNFHTFIDRVALTHEQQIRFSDYGTDLTVPENGIAAIIAGHSRALGDLNRDPDDPGRFQKQDYAQPTRHDIWKSGRGLTEQDMAYCQKVFYDPFHEMLQSVVREQKTLFVVAWDNTAHYTIGADDAGNAVSMQPIILSNRGVEESGEDTSEEIASCDPLLLQTLAAHLRKELTLREVPNEVCLNLVFKGGYICRQYSARRNKDWLAERGILHPVQSFQVEYDTFITHDQESLAPNTHNIRLLKEAFSEAFEQTLRTYTNID